MLRDFASAILKLFKSHAAQKHYPELRKLYSLDPIHIKAHDGQNGIIGYQVRLDQDGMVQDVVLPHAIGH